MMIKGRETPQNCTKTGTEAFLTGRLNTGWVMCEREQDADQQGRSCRVIELEVSCRQCARIHTPSRDDFRRGVWRVCRRCRDPSESQSGMGHESSSQTLGGAKNAPNVSSGPDRQGETAA
jgi:hypothetical protein